MIRFAWIQARTQTLAVATGLAAMAVVLAITGPHLVHLYDAAVRLAAPPRRLLGAAAQPVHHPRQQPADLDGVLIGAVPGLLGVFWGAPLVARELESGTFRLVWTQSVTRTRWLAVKLGLVGLATMTAAGLLSLIVTWWASPLDRAHLNIFNTFDERDIVPIGFALFAFVLGVAAGLIIRRTLPAMAITLVAFVGARLAITNWVRPNLISPLHTRPDR